MVVGEALFELFREPAREGFGFGERQLAELGAGAGYCAAEKRGRFDRKAGGVQLVDDRRDVGFGDVDEEEILHWRVANVTIAVAFSEVGSERELRGSDTATGYGGADGEKARLFLRDDAEMVAVDLGGWFDRFSGTELVTEFCFDGGEERGGGPAMFEEKILHTGFVARVAKDLGFAKDSGDGADNGDDLVPLDEGVERDGKMGLGREATGDAEGESDFGGSAGWRVASGK